ncbi:MAG: HDIG domain-containing protein [Candidatus Omnitrophica bacterium]|nr:HDIG domain-containing protein [Candidatus Omnitrophota bacterium]
MNKLDKYEKVIKTITRKEVISLFLIMVFVIAAISSIFISPRFYQGSMQEGDIALKDVYAPYDFVYFWEIDEGKNAKVREEAVKDAPYFIRVDRSAEKGSVANIKGFFKVLEGESKKDIPENEKIEFIQTQIESKVPANDIKILLENEDIKGFEQKVLLILEKIYLLGYIDDGSLKFLKSEKKNKVVLYNERDDSETEKSTGDFLDADKVDNVVKTYVSKDFEHERNERKAAVQILSGYIAPNLVLDEKKTDLKKEEALKKVKPVYREWPVKKNELIIEKGIRVDAGHIAQFSQLRRVFRPGVTPTFLLGVVLLFVLLGVLGIIDVAFTQKKGFFRDTKNIAIILLNMFFMLIEADFIIHSPQPSYFIPMAGMGMIITILVGFNVAFLSVLLLSILISLLMGGGVGVLFVFMVGSLVGMYAVRDTRRRSQILWAGLWVGIAKFTTIACVGLINGMELDFYIHDGLWGIASGIFSGFIVLALLPVFEYLFKVPTNITLLELSDLNHPLLKELAMKAPGTYHHSIMVGNLAEAACDSIGANSLLARVGAYYHDIGKIPQAEYFAENEMSPGSRHAKLSPSMSALIIGKHVKKGVEIAKKHKLNKAIIDFITQHHGDSQISYFYQKALEQSENGIVAKEESFRYPGPKPQTKESAIILLADSVEAASRTLEEPTPSSIRNLVRKMINNKFIDSQLDECDLTLKDMHKIADSFVRVLMGIFHTRLTYPEDTQKETLMDLPDEQDNDKKPKQ